MTYVVAALKESLDTKRGWYDKAHEAMLAEKLRLKHRIEDLDIKIAKHDRADINYHEFGVRILELAKNAQKLFELATPTEKQELLRFLLSNSTLKDEKPKFTLKKPFLQIAKRSPLREHVAWGAVVEEVRTVFEKRNDATIYMPDLSPLA